MDIKPLYKDSQKVDITEQLLQSFETNLTTAKKFETEEQTESPVVLMWTLCLYAQHYDAKGDTVQALKKIQQAIDHTPTLMELYLFQGRIFKVGFFSYNWQRLNRTNSMQEIWKKHQKCMRNQERWILLTVISILNLQSIYYVLTK